MDKKNLSKYAVTGSLLLLLNACNSGALPSSAAMSPQIDSTTNVGALPAGVVAKYLIQDDDADQRILLNKINPTTGATTGSIGALSPDFKVMGYDQNHDRLYLTGNGLFPTFYKACGISTTGQLACNEMTYSAMVPPGDNTNIIKFVDNGSSSGDSLAFYTNGTNLFSCSASSNSGSLNNCQVVFYGDASVRINQIDVATVNGKVTLYYSATSPALGTGIYSCLISGGRCSSSSVKGGPSYGLNSSPFVVDPNGGYLYVGVDGQEALQRFALNSSNNSVSSVGTSILSYGSAPGLAGLALNQTTKKLYAVLQSNNGGEPSNHLCDISGSTPSCASTFVVGQPVSGQAWVSYSK